MYDCRSSIVRICAERVRLSGVELASWMAEHDITLSMLNDPEQRLPWRSFAGILQRLEKILGGPLALEQFGSEYAAAYPLFRQLANLHFGLAEIQQIAAERLVPELFGGAVQPLVSLQPGGAMRITLALEHDLTPSHAFWTLMLGLWRPIPRLFELGDSFVEVEMADRFAEFLVIFPSERLDEPADGDAIRRRVRESLLDDLVRHEQLLKLPSPDPKTSVLQRRINSVSPAQERAAMGLAELEQEIRSRLNVERMQLFETTDVGLKRRGSVGAALDGPRIRRMFWVSGVAVGAIEIERQGDAGHAREASLLDEHIERFSLRFAELHHRLPYRDNAGGFAPAEAELGEPSTRPEAPPSSRGRVARAAREGRLRELTEAWQLSERQRAVLALLVDGLGNREIAARLGCTTGTIENHVTKLLKRAGVESRSALTAAFWKGQRR